jgi:hypothetical protein
VNFIGDIPAGLVEPFRLERPYTRRGLLLLALVWAWLCVGHVRLAHHHSTNALCNGPQTVIATGTANSSGPVQCRH